MIGGTEISGLLLIIKKSIDRLQAGQVLEVKSRERTVADDLPAWCRMVEHEFLGFEKNLQYTSYYVRKGGSTSSVEEDLEAARGYQWSVRVCDEKGLLAKAFSRNHTLIAGQPAEFSPKETKEDLAVDIVAVLREEMTDLIKVGVDFIQIDEPVLTELVFTQKNANRTFMCGALTAKAGAEEELAFATELMNKLTEGLRGRGTKIGIHVCRGNWSTQEETLLRGPYYPLMPFLAQMNVDQYVLEYATPRAGELHALTELAKKDDVEVGLGVVNPRTPTVETVEEIVARVRQAAKYFPIKKIYLNHDCGFGTFAQRPMNTPEIAKRKLSNMHEAAKILRQELLNYKKRCYRTRWV